MPQIIVTISPQGNPTIASSGFAGSSCRVATSDLEAALGLRTDEQLTAEFYQSEISQTEQHHRQ